MQHQALQLKTDQRTGSMQEKVPPSSPSRTRLAAAVNADRPRHPHTQIIADIHEIEKAMRADGLEVHKYQAQKEEHEQEKEKANRQASADESSMRIIDADVVRLQRELQHKALEQQRIEGEANQSKKSTKRAEAGQAALLGAEDRKQEQMVEDLNQRKTSALRFVTEEQVASAHEQMSAAHAAKEQSLVTNESRQQAAEARIKQLEMQINIKRAQNTNDESENERKLAATKEQLRESEAKIDACEKERSRVLHESAGKLKKLEHEIIATNEDVNEWEKFAGELGDDLRLLNEALEQSLNGEMPADTPNDDMEQDQLEPQAEAAALAAAEAMPPPALQQPSQGDASTSTRSTIQEQLLAVAPAEGVLQDERPAEQPPSNDADAAAPASSLHWAESVPESEGASQSQSQSQTQSQGHAQPSVTPASPAAEAQTMATDDDDNQTEPYSSSPALAQASQASQASQATSQPSSQASAHPRVDSDFDGMEQDH